MNDLVKRAARNTGKTLRAGRWAGTNSAEGLTAARLGIRAVICTPGSVLDFAPQDNTEGRAVTRLGLILEHAAELFNDAGGNRQAEAGAGFLRAEERVEKALLDFGRDALAVVSHFKDNGCGLAPVERGACGARAERDRAIAVNGFSGVANKVDQHLF